MIKIFKYILLMSLMLIGGFGGELYAQDFDYVQEVKVFLNTHQVLTNEQNVMVLKAIDRFKNDRLVKNDSELKDFHEVLVKRVDQDIRYLSDLYQFLEILHLDPLGSRIGKVDQAAYKKGVNQLNKIKAQYRSAGIRDFPVGKDKLLKSVEKLAAVLVQPDQLAGFWHETVEMIKPAYQLWNQKKHMLDEYLIQNQNRYHDRNVILTYDELTFIENFKDVQNLLYKVTLDQSANF